MNSRCFMGLTQLQGSRIEYSRCWSDLGTCVAAKPTADCRFPLGVINVQCGPSRTLVVSASSRSGQKADSYPGRLETRDRLRFLGGLACEEVFQDIFAIRRDERLLANFTTQQVVKRLGLRLYPYHLVVRSTLRTGEAGGIVMHRYQARSGSSHHLPLSCSSALS